MTDNKDVNLAGQVRVSLGGDGESEMGMGRGQLMLPPTLPILPVKDMSMFPRMVLPMMVNEAKHQLLVNEVLAGDKTMGLVALRSGKRAEDVTGADDIYQVGVVAQILRMSKGEDEGEGMRLMAQGLMRFVVKELIRTEPFILAMVEPARETPAEDIEAKALVSNLRGHFAQVLKLAQHLPDELGQVAAGLDDPGSLADMVASALNLEPHERQGVVEALDVKERLRRVNALLSRELEVLELGSKIQSQVKEGLDKSQREFYLRQQLKAIQDELGEGEGGSEEGEAAELARRLAEKELPDEARAEAERELKRLAKMHPSASDYHVITTYLDWVLALPWRESSEDRLDIAGARDILEADHYDLEKVKRRILEYLAVRKLNPDMKGPILCFVGPPGVGKTSLGRSIARALGREFARISLGGVRDEAEIRGHRRTYVGALPGRIIQHLRRAGTNNPVFMLDEVDKLGADFRGDPSSALLEVLDPEQNSTFSDHYLDVAFDLSKVMFIATANVLETIPPPLRDRMEVIEIPGYTAEDKLKIARRYLVPRQREQHGLAAKQVAISDAAVKKLISGYTREAGLRNLERELGSLCRHAARKIAEGDAKRVSIGVKQVGEILGPEKLTPDTRLRTAVPGVATGLAWTPAGGDILFIEATAMPGAGKLNLTGQLGDVMKESARAAVSFVRSKAGELGVDSERFAAEDLHIHIPAGAIPKDGPSAGVTMYTALLSLLTGRPVKSEVAMTGEITLRGMVLPVGGIKDKVLAAHRAGIKTVILPEQNRRDLEEVPEAVKKALKFRFAQRMDRLADWALQPGGKSSRPKRASRARQGREARGMRKAARRR